ncbi:MAG: class I SAM-dependent methyltransferase [Terracidiphilus sp.]
MRSLKSRSKLLLRLTFELGQRLGFDILPRHFYSEIPDISALKNTSAWKKPRSFFGMRREIEAQVAWVDECSASFRANLKGFEIHKAAVRMNGSDEGYGEVEADFLYCFVRSHRPAEIIQIGCGVSTAICLLAAKDEGFNPKIICIEPYPTEFLRRESQAGRIELVAKKVEEVGSECASWLHAGGLFFVDSSHTLAPAGEVNLIVFEMLPRLAPGTYVHFHDIHFPYDYNPDTLSTALFFQHETALLYAFLLMNDHFEILGSLGMLHHQRLSDLIRFFPDMNPRTFDEGLTLQDGQFPSSIFLRRTR